MKKFLVLALMAGLLATAVRAEAADILSLLDSGNINLASDNSAEQLLNAATGYAPDTGDSILDVGDRLRGIFDIGTIENAKLGGQEPVGASGNNEWSGIFEAEVISKVAGPGGFVFTFGPSASFAATHGAGAMIVMYEDATPDYTRLGADDAGGAAEAALETLATNGSHFWTLGFDGAPGTYWTATATSDDVSVIASLLPGVNGGTVNFGVNLLSASVPLTLSKLASGLGTADIIGNGNILGTGGFATPFDVFDDFNVVFVPNVIPEPTTMLLFGSGLAGLAGAGIRKKQRA